MTRKKSTKITQEICMRFCNFVETKLNLSYTELARELKYSNPSIFTAVKNSKSFIHIEKLSDFALLSKKHGVNIDLNWLITGIKKDTRTNHFNLSDYPHISHFLTSMDLTTLQKIERQLSKTDCNTLYPNTEPDE